MVSIVIVSHSQKLAEGVRELARQMVQDKVPIAVAAGIDDPENPLGTDAMQVYEAIASVYSDDGVLVLMDLGSALLSAEMAIEFLPESQQDKIHLCEAPLVEGAIAASVAATSSNDINRIISEARQALTAKAAQLSINPQNQHSTAPLFKGSWGGSPNARNPPNHSQPPRTTCSSCGSICHHSNSVSRSNSRAKYHQKHRICESR